MPASRSRPWRLTATGVALRVRVTPKSSRQEVEGIDETAEGPALKVRVRAVPEDGAANQAVMETVARWLGLPKKSVTLASGGKSRIKTLALAGASADLDQMLVERLG